MNFRLLLPVFLVCTTGLAQSAPRARALRVPFDGTPGPLDAITDVKGVEATEEAIVNAMVGAETMTGVDGHTIDALPHDKLTAFMKHSPQLTLK
jgi:D-aminopeptidase